MEEYKDIIGYDGIYIIYRNGIVKNTKSNKIMTESKHEYPMVALNKNGTQYTHTVHRLLALHFIPNPKVLPFVNHIDGNKGNYNLDNLEWVTGRENNFHAFENNLYKNEKSYKWYIGREFISKAGDVFVVETYLNHSPCAYYVCRFLHSNNEVIASIYDIKRSTVGDRYKKAIFKDDSVKFFSNVKYFSKISTVSDRTIHESIRYNKTVKDILFQKATNIKISDAYNLGLLKDKQIKIFEEFLTL